MEAVQELRQRVADNPEDTVALRQLAGMNYNIQNWSRAIELYRRYLELEPDDADAKTDLGACLLASGKPTEALELFRQVRQAFPNHWQARYNELLVLIFNLEDYEAADVAMKELQAMLPGNQDVERLAEELARRRQGA
jgi:tetratricopeptide (TPR) repeat protein